MHLDCYRRVPIWHVPGRTRNVLEIRVGARYLFKYSFMWRKCTDTVGTTDRPEGICIRRKSGPKTVLAYGDLTERRSIVIAGGAATDSPGHSSPGLYHDSTELFDPETQTSSAARSMSVARTRDEGICYRTVGSQYWVRTSLRWRFTIRNLEDSPHTTQHWETSAPQRYFPMARSSLIAYWAWPFSTRTRATSRQFPGWMADAEAIRRQCCWMGAYSSLVAATLRAWQKQRKSMTRRPTPLRKLGNHTTNGGDTRPCFFKTGRYWLLAVVKVLRTLLLSQ